MVTCISTPATKLAGCAWNCSFGKAESVFLSCGKEASPVCLPKPCGMSWQGQAIMAGIILTVAALALAIRIWREKRKCQKT